MKADEIVTGQMYSDWCKEEAKRGLKEPEALPGLKEPESLPFVIPEREYLGHQWHWLHSERSLSPCFSEWVNGGWWSAGEGNRITPEEMHRRGWRWLAPAIPPRLPMDKDADEEDLDYIPKVKAK
jgi:hypothetical protein